MASNRLEFPIVEHTAAVLTRDEYLSRLQVVLAVRIHGARTLTETAGDLSQAVLHPMLNVAAMYNSLVDGIVVA